MSSKCEANEMACYYNLIGAIIKQAIVDYLRWKLYDKRKILYSKETTRNNILAFGKQAEHFLFGKEQLENFLRRFDMEHNHQECFIRRKVKTLLSKLSRGPTVNVMRYLKTAF